MYRIILLLLAFTVFAPDINGLCPVPRGMVAWSNRAAWPNRQIPKQNDEVVINRPVILDISPPPLKNIRITKEGRLWWSDRRDIHLRTNYILIEGGMDIGSEDCKYSRKAEITLMGRRGDYQDVGLNGHHFGQKFIGVLPGGSLEIHGEKKLPWTKLTKTIPRLDSKTGLLFDHYFSPNGHLRYKDWFVIYTFNDNGKMVEYKPIHYSRWNDLMRYLDGVPKGRVVLMAGFVSFKKDTKYLNYLENFAHGWVTGKGKLRKAQKWNSWTMLVVKGHPQFSKEELATLPGRDLNHYTTEPIKVIYKSVVYTLQADVLYRNGNTKLVARAVQQRASQPIIDLLDDANSWKEGDKIIVTSTDYDWKQVEERTILPCKECKRNQIKVDGDFVYEHYGQIINNVDMRAEVALLTRNIKIHGEVGDTCYGDNRCDLYKFDNYGGHIKVERGFKTLHVEGAELYHMGQHAIKGHYPIHCHLCLDVDEAGGYNPRSYIRQNAIHHTFSRCSTMHATHGMLIQDNVAYDHFGHCFFVENGGEKRNLFEGNLALGTRLGSLETSDKRAVSFWVTNPTTYFRNNVAGGGDGTGIWFIFPEKQPIHESKHLNLFGLYEINNTPLGQFQNNVAHSYKEFGINTDNQLNDHGDICCKFRWNPYKVVKQTSNGRTRKISVPYDIVFDRLTSYKNRKMNSWIGGTRAMRVTKASFEDALKMVPDDYGDIGTSTLAGAYPHSHVETPSLSDSPEGLTFVTNLGTPTLMDSVVVGESSNLGHPTWIRDVTQGNKNILYPRSIPDINNRIHSINFRGWINYDCSPRAKNVWFGGYQSTKYRPAGAIGMRNGGYGPSCPYGGTTNMKFGYIDSGNVKDMSKDGYGNRVWPRDRNGGRESNTVTDYDGSVTGQGLSVIVRNIPFNQDNSCTVRENWNATICPPKLGRIQFSLSPDFQRYQNAKPHIDITMIRADDPSATYTLHDGQWILRYANVISQKTYIVKLSSHFSKASSVPTRIGMSVSSLTPIGGSFDRITVGVCLNPNTRFSIGNGKGMKSYAEFKKTSSGKLQRTNMPYFWDTKNGILFVALSSSSSASITRTSGTSTPYDCTKAAFRVYKESGGTKTKAAVALTDVMLRPPKNWGAGDTRPRDVVHERVFG